MPSERLIEAINEQIGREYAAAHQYVAIGAFYDLATFPNLARFLTSRRKRSASTRRRWSST